MLLGRIIATPLVLTAVFMAVAVCTPLREPVFDVGGGEPAEMERVTYASVVVTTSTARQELEMIENYVDDPSFEVAGTALGDWIAINDGNHTIQTNARSTSQKKYGAASLLVDVTNTAGSGSTGQRFNAAPGTVASGQIWSFGVWLNVTAFNGQEFQFQVTWRDSSDVKLGTLLANRRAATTDFAHQFIQLRIENETAPANTSYFRIDLFFNSGAASQSGTGYWDGLMAVQASTLPTAWTSGRDVRNHFVEEIQLFPQDAIVTLGQRFLFTAVALDIAVEPMPAVDFEWRVKDPDAGSITSTGLFTAGMMPGMYLDAVEVSAISEGGMISRTASVKIITQRESQARHLDTVVVYPPDITVKPGQIVGLGALGWSSRGQLVQDVQLNWSMMTHKAGAVDQLGFFKASMNSGGYPKAIQVTATQETSTGRVERQSFISVTVTEDIQMGELSQVLVVPGAVTLTPGQKVGLIAKAFDQSGQRVSKVSFTWKVTQPEAVTMEEQGYFVANSQVGEFPNAIQVVATQETPEGSVQAEASISVTVEPAPENLARAHLVPREISLRPGQRLLFAAYGLDANGTPVPTSVTWELADPSAGSVSQDGVFIPGEPGLYRDAVRVRLTQEEGGRDTVVEAFATVNIVGSLETLEISAPVVTLQVGQSIILVVVGYDANGLEIPMLHLRWGVENPLAGSINEYGLFTAGAEPGRYEDAIRVTAVELDTS